MAVNNVTLKTGETLIDLTKDTINENVVFEGFTGHNSKGEPFTGKLKRDADTLDGYHIEVGSSGTGKKGYLSFFG